MLSKEFRVKKFKDFEKIFEEGNFKSVSSFYIKYIENNDSFSKVSVVVPKKVSKLAVIRNRFKRQLSEIIRLRYKELKSGFNIVVICKEEILSKKYKDLDQEWEELIEKADLKI